MSVLDLPTGPTSVTIEKQSNPTQVSDTVAAEFIVDMFKGCVDESEFCFTLSAIGPEEKLVYCNKAFYRATQYSANEVIGRKCNFLQGENTSQQSISELRRAIKSSEAVCQDILNYRKDKTPFWNRLVLVPYRRKEQFLYLGLQNIITADKANERQQQLSSEEIKDIFNNLLTKLILGKEYSEVSKDKEKFKAMMEESQRLIGQRINEL